MHVVGTAPNFPFLSRDSGHIPCPIVGNRDFNFTTLSTSSWDSPFRALMLTSYKNITAALIDFSTIPFFSETSVPTCELPRGLHLCFLVSWFENFSFQLHHGFMPCEKAVIPSGVLLQAHCSLTEPYINIIK